MVFAVPALLLLVAAGVPVALAWLRARSQIGALLLLVLLLIPAASAVQHVIVPWGRADCAGASAYVLAHRRPGDLMVGNSWEYLYYFRHCRSDYVSLEDASFPTQARVWLLLTGSTAQERLRMGQRYAAAQGRLAELHLYERTDVFLIEPFDSSDGLESHSLAR